MKLLIFLNRFDKDKETIKYKLNKLNSKIISQEKENLILESESIKQLLSLQETSKIFKITTDWKILKFNQLKEDTLNSILESKVNNYKIQTKFHDKIKISAKSVYKHINPYLKHENFQVNGENPEVILYLEFKKENNNILCRVSYSLSEWYSPLNPTSTNYSNFVVIIENPVLVDEVSDFLRLCWIFKIPLYILTKNKDFERTLNKAKIITKGIDYTKMKLFIIKELPKEFILVGFSKLARENETNLSTFLSKEKRKIALVFGDDKFGLTQETRDKMNIMFRLTPDTKKPLRASHALSYILGIYTQLKMIS